MRLIASLIDLVLPRRTDAARVGSLPSGALAARVAPRLTGVTDPPAVALLSFGDAAAAAAIREAKYHADPHASRLLAEALAAYLADAGEDSTARLALLPMPLAAARLRERGFNQCERVAREALELVPGCAIALETELLARERGAPPQAQQSAALRTRSLREAFVCRGIPRADTLYIVLDDVVTTGTTMQAALDALRSAGARHIAPLALAH